MAHTDFTAWNDELNKLCIEMYAIKVTDIGLDEAVKRKYWLEDESPLEVAEYLGSKFDLIFARSVNWGSSFD